MADNCVIEKYCYNDDENICTIYGALFQWDEMMQYTTIEGVQGICPPGWHIPTDMEFQVLEGVVDSQYGVGAPVWDGTIWRGFDAGLNLKFSSGWGSGGNGTDLFDFSGLPGGYCYFDGTFDGIGGSGFWWTTTQYGTYRAWGRSLGWYYSSVGRNFDTKTIGFSVRCIKN